MTAREHAIREMALLAGFRECAKYRTERAMIFLVGKWLAVLRRKNLLLPPL